MEKRCIALLGNSLILETLGESLRRFPQNEVIGFFPPGTEQSGIAALHPEVIIFDLDSPRPQNAFSLLESGPGLVLIGVSSDTNLVKMWTGRQLREMSIRDLLKVIQGEAGSPPAHSIEADGIHQVIGKIKNEKEAKNRGKRR